MSDKLDAAAQTMINNLEKNSGKALAEWVAIVRATGLAKHGEIVKYLKTEHGFTHGYANMVSIRARETADSPATADDQVANQYTGKEALRPIYDAIIDAVTRFGDDVEISPKKAYVSLRRSKQFGLVQPSTKTRLDLGLNLGDVAANDRLEQSGSFNSMVSHRVRLSQADDVDEELIGWLRQAYEAA
jgi:predicted transport protein